MKKLNEFYPAYAVRKFVDTDDIFAGPVASYEEAEQMVDDMMIDDDDGGVFTKVDGEWYRIWARTKDGVFDVSRAVDGRGRLTAFVSDWY